MKSFHSRGLTPVEGRQAMRLPHQAPPVVRQAGASAELRRVGIMPQIYINQAQCITTPLGLLCHVESPGGGNGGGPPSGGGGQLPQCLPQNVCEQLTVQCAHGSNHACKTFVAYCVACDPR